MAGAYTAACAQPYPAKPVRVILSFRSSAWFGFVGPANLTKPVVEKLSAALVSSTRDPATSKLLLDNGADPVGGTPEAHEAFIKSEVSRWQKVTRAAGITPE